MPSTKKLTSLIFAIIFGIMTCGIGFVMPMIAGRFTSKTETATAVNYSASLINSGLSQDPNGFYKIETVEHLNGVAYAIAQDMADWASGNYALENDLDLGYALWTPIGTATNPFVGKFNGNGHTIQGVISVSSSSVDTTNPYSGLFGCVGDENPATVTAIYDLVIGKYSFTPPYSDFATSGRLAGSVKNTVLADIYDWQYLTIPQTLNFQTIGTIGTGVEIFGGSSFVLAEAPTETGGEWSYALKTPQNYTPTDSGFQFGYGATSGLTVSGESIYIADDENGYFYSKDDEAKTDLGGVRILKDTNGAVIDASTKGIISARYVQELPTILGEDGTSSAFLAPVGTGKKPAGYVTDVNATTTPIKTISGYNGDGPLYVKWKDLSYNISISYDSRTVSVGTFGYNTAMGSLKQLSGDNFLKTIEAKREGFSLSGLKYNNDQIYSATFSWTEAGDRTVENENFYGNNTLTRWDGEGTVNITLQAEWVSAPVNFNITFSATNDSGADLSGLGIATATYQNSSVEENYDVEYDKNQSNNNKYDVRALSGEVLIFKITVPEGYNISGIAGGSTASYNAESGVLTVNGAVVNENIILNVERIVYDITINAENFSTITTSGGSIEGKGDESWTFHVKVNSEYTLTAVINEGYGFANISSSGSGFTVSTQAVDGATGPIQVNINVTSPIEVGSSITLSAKALTFKASLVNHKEEYTTQAQNTGSVTLINGEERHTWAGDGKLESFNAPGEDGIEINITNTSYYKINLDQPGATYGLKITTDYDGVYGAKGVSIVCETSTTTPQETSKYKISGIQAGGTYYFQVYWAKQEYTATAGSGSTSSVDVNDFNINIPGADGSYVSDADKVNIVKNVVKVNNASASSYNPFDELKFTYNIVSQYYKYVDWYYHNGDAYVLINESTKIFGSPVTISGTTLSFAAPAQNVEVFVAVTGKTATVSLPADATHYYEYNGGIVNAAKALSTLAPTSSITFKYGDPDLGSFTVVMNNGYNLSRVIIGPSSASLADLNADDFYDFGTDLNYNGYQNILNLSSSKLTAEELAELKDELLSDIFIKGKLNIYVLATPKSATLSFDDGFEEGEGTGSAEPIAYYFGIPVDITNAVNAFSKKGYTANGWKVNVSGNDQTLTDPSDTTSSLYYKTADGRYMLNLSAGLITDIATAQSFTLIRTYEVDTYELVLNAGKGEFEGGSKTTEIANITFGQAISQTLATPTRTGYTFGGWQIGGESINSETVWKWTSENADKSVEATAVWTAKEYTVKVDLNGGFAGGETILSFPLVYDTGIGGNETFEGLDGMISRQGFILNSLVLLTEDNKYIDVEIIRGEAAKTFNINDFPNFDFDNSTSITLYVRWVFVDDAITATFDSNGTSITYNASLQEITNIITISENKTGITPVTEWQYSKTGSSNWKALPEGVEGLATSLKVKNVADTGYYRASLISTDNVGPAILRDSKTIDFAVDGVVPNKYIEVSPAQLLSFDDITTGVLSGDGEKQFYEVVKYLYNIPAIQNMVKEAESDEALIASFEANALTTYESFFGWITDAYSDGMQGTAIIEMMNKLGYVSKIFYAPIVFNPALRQIYIDAIQNGYNLGGSPDKISEAVATLTKIENNWGKDFLKFDESDVTVGEGGGDVEGVYTFKSVLCECAFVLGSSSFNYTTDFNATGNYWYDNLSIVSTFTSQETSQASISDRFTILPIDNLTGDDNIVTDASKLTENTNAGLHEVVIKITPQEGFDSSNFEGISEINGEYYIVLTKGYLAKVQAMPDQEEGYKWSGIHAPILYPSITVAQMPVSQVVGNGEIQKFEDSVDLTDDTNGKYTEAYLYIETSSAEPGLYTFLNDASADRKITISKYELYVSGSSADKASAVYYVFTRQGDGSYNITETHGEGITNSDPVLADVSLFVDGDLEILANTDQNIETLTFQTVELTVNTENNQKLSGSLTPSGYGIKVNSISVSGSAGTFTVNISNETNANYYCEGNAFYDNNKTFLFQVNDLSNPSIVYFNTLSNYQVTSINVTSTNPAKANYNFVGFRQWIENQSLNDLATELKSLSNWASSTTGNVVPVSVEEVLQSATYSAVYINASWVTFDAKTDANQSFGFTPSSFFATIGSTVSFDDYDNSINYDVYTFDGFGASETLKTVNIAGNPNQTFTAVIGLATPRGIGLTNQTLATELNGTFNLSDLEEHVDISNSDETVTYVYEWFKGDSFAGAEKVDSPISKDVTSNGTYWVKVTATKVGYDDSDVSQEISFEIKFEKTSVALTAPSTTTVTYDTGDFADDIKIGVTLTNAQNPNLPTYEGGIALSNIATDPTLKDLLDVTIQKDALTVSQIKNAGNYTITISLKSEAKNVYDLSESLVFTFTVNKAQLKLTTKNVTRADGTGFTDGVLFTKVYGEQDPTFDVKVAGLNGDVVELRLVRTSTGQTVDKYSLSLPDDYTNENYELTLDTNEWFEITSVKGLTLQVTSMEPYDGTNNSRVYDGNEHAEIVGMEVVTPEGSDPYIILTTYYDYVNEYENTPWAKYKLSEFILLEETEGGGSSESEKAATITTEALTGITFTLDVGKDVGTYAISVKGTNGTYPGGFSFKNGNPTLEITAKKLTLSGFTKEYDGNTEFNTENGHTVEKEGLVYGEDLNVTATFDNATVGTGKTLTGITLVDGTGFASNYTIDPSSDKTGTITKSSKTLSVEATKGIFVYGERGLDEGTLTDPEDPLTALNSLIEKMGIVVKVDGTIVEKSLYKLTVTSLGSASYSTAGYLKVGYYTVAINLTSDYYTVVDSVTGNDNATNEFTLTVNQKDITATFDGPITKAYDDDNVVEQEISLSDIIASDVVRIDSATYNNKNVGKDKVVTIAISGDDAGNYNLTNSSVTGEITNVVIRLKFDISYEFVDNQNATIENNVTSFTLTYNEKLTGESAIARLISPKKSGYTFKDWAVGVQGGSGTIGGLKNGTILSTENIMGFIKKLREDNEYSANIYATWKIKDYTITIIDETDWGNFEIKYSGGTQTGSTTPTSGDLETGTWTYTYTYYTEVTVSLVANSGYVVNEDSSEATTKSEPFTVTDDKTINIKGSHKNEYEDNDFRLANITIEISIDPDSYHGGKAISFENTGADVWTVSSYRAQTTLTSEGLSSTNLQTYFARTVLDGYTFSGWSYQNADSEKVTIDYNAGGTQNLSDIITKIYSSYTKDITVSFTAILKANKYELSFDANGGTLGEPSPKITVTYGEAINETLPTLKRAGYVFSGWQIEGETITTETVWKWAENKTAIAVWTDGDYSLTVTLTDSTENSNANVTISYTNEQGGTSYVVDNNPENKIFNFTLNRGITYKILITTNKGYNVEWGSYSDFELTGTGNERTIKNITNNSTLGITISAMTHEVTITGLTNATYGVKVDGTAPSISSDKFNASTEETIVVTLTPSDGYSVTGNATVTAGAQISKSENQFTITDFNDNITINFANVVSANSYDATVKYNENEIKVAGLSGTSQNEDGLITFTVKVTTGGELVFYIQDLHGYNYNDIQKTGTVTVNVDKSPMEDGTYAGYRKVTVSGYTQTFGLEIKTTKVKFDVNASIVAVDSEFNIMPDVEGISVEKATQQIEYLTNATVKAVNNNPVYGFKGWYDSSVIDEDGNVVTIEGDPISIDLAYTFTVEDNVSLVAIFQYNTYNVEIKIEYTERASDGTDHATIDVNGTKNLNGWKQTMSYDDELEVTADVDDGYKVVGWYVGAVDDSAEGKDDTYTTTITGELTLILVVDAVDLQVEIVPTVRINGVAYSGEDISGLPYGTIELGTYSDGKFTPTKDLISAKDFDVESYTGGEFYLRLSAKEGYSLDTLYNYNISGNPIFSLVTEQENSKIYQITGLNSVNEYQIEARFIAVSTPITIVFSNGENRLEAGRITVTSAPGLNIVQNNSHNVVVNATTTSKVYVTASISLGQLFVDSENALSNIKITSSGTILDPKIITPDASTGWSAQLSFEITEFTGTPLVEILVTPKTYNVQLVGWDGDEIGEPFAVTYGTPIVLPEGLTISPRDGFALLGFYKYANGVGTRYIDGDLNPIGNWTDNGYQRNSEGVYVVSANFNADTFRIFASYSINKARLQIDVVPPGLEDVPPTVAAKIVVLGTTTANSWSSSTDSSFVEVRDGATISLQAPVYENYRFGFWSIVRTDKNGASRTERVESETIENFEHDGYSLVSITLNYFAKVSVTATIGGTATYKYYDGTDMVEVADTEYIPTTSPIKLNATADPGYKFVAWFVDGNPNPISYEPNFEYSASSTDPIEPTEFEARFESQTFSMTINVQAPETVTLQKVIVGGQEVNFGEAFDVKLNQIVNINLDIVDGVSIVWKGGYVVPLANGYLYRVSYNDVVDGKINLDIYASYEECDVNITVNVINGDETDKTLAANIYYLENGASVQISAINGVTITRTVGSTLELRIDLRENYRLDGVLINDRDSEAVVDGNIVRIIVSPKTEYGNSADVQINLARDYWIDYVDAEDYDLTGSGTDSDPYIISSASDLSYVAYMVNVEGSKDYADAVYVLGDNIDLTGKFWSPIGTEENKFNGKFYYRNFQIVGARPVRDYQGDISSDYVFGFVTDNAEFEMPQGDWLIAVIIVSIVLLLIIIALIIFFVLRKKRKKKLEQLANS